MGMKLNNTKESDLVYRPSADDTFCKSQLITCSRVKECNGVCPFEDALKHADKTQTMDEQHTINHDREWIIGCIEHDGFIHTHRFDKANQIIHDALSAEAVQGEWIDIDRYYHIATCSHCHKVTMFEKWGECTRPYNFCPNCGAKMLGEDGEA